MWDTPSRAGEVLAAVHRSPGLPRAELCERLGLSSGLASDLVARLEAGSWLRQGDAVSEGRPGRPTRTLWPHPAGPLVVAAVIRHEGWRVDVCELGGGSIDAWEEGHDGALDPTRRALAGALELAWRRHGRRIRAISVTAPGTVSGTRLVQASNLGWEDVELAALAPAAAREIGVPVRAGNDASDTALGELARGAAEGVGEALVVFMDSGVGGALIDGGRVLAGAHGMAGEFGHLPFGSPRTRCRCGALGCWNSALDGAALARMLGRPLPADEVSFARDVLAAAERGPGEERRAARALARVLGRGLAGLANAADPERVVLCGLAADLLAVAPAQLERAYRVGLMSTRAGDPAPLCAGRLGDRAPLTGAVQAAFAPVLAHPLG